jgi:hypothetical protein
LTVWGIVQPSHHLRIPARSSVNDGFNMPPPEGDPAKRRAERSTLAQYLRSLENNEREER